MANPNTHFNVTEATSNPVTVFYTSLSLLPLITLNIYKDKVTSQPGVEATIQLALCLYLEGLSQYS